MLRKTLKYIFLWPLSLGYDCITRLRNLLYDRNVFSSRAFSLPLIGIGNLAVGGTGKTPHAELVLNILQDEWQTALLSRGYKRKTRGFVLADSNASSETIGDEPYQIFRKFPKVKIAVDEERVHGVASLLKLFPRLQCIVLDDVFQHRKIKSGLSILLTDYSSLYIDDALLPLGRLRERPSGSDRADVIIVTKCKEDIDFSVLERRLDLKEEQSLFFSALEYGDAFPLFPNFSRENYSMRDVRQRTASVLLLTGIVSPLPMVEYVMKHTKQIEQLSFPDHHSFSDGDFLRIKRSFEKMPGDEKIILTTEKDAARLLWHSGFPAELKPCVYVLPIRIRILNNKTAEFVKKIKDYVRANQTDSRIPEEEASGRN